LVATVGAAFEAGWRSVKLYFMCGLPTETDEDVVAIAQLAHRVIETGRAITGHRDIACTVSLGAFVPKPHTPFQWVGQADVETATRRIILLKQALRDDRKCGRAITLRYSDARVAQLEGLLARGDRRVGNVIEAVWRAGQTFDGWREHENIDLWESTAADVLDGVDWAWFTTRPRPKGEVLPWDHLSVGLNRNWLWRDYVQAVLGQTMGDCRWDGCELCGVCTAFDTDIELAADPGFVSGRPLTRKALVDA